MSWDREFAETQAQRAAATPPAPPAEPEAPSPAKRAALQPLNDFGNGQRVLLYFGEDLMFVPRVGWFVWDGSVWAQDFDGMSVRKRAHQVAGLIVQEALQLVLPDREAAIVALAEDSEVAYDDLVAIGARARNDVQNAEYARLSQLRTRAAALTKRLLERRGKFLRHAKAAGNSGPITNMLREVEPYVERQIKALNVDPLLINCETGTLSLERRIDEHEAAWAEDARPKHMVGVRPHDRADLITKMMPVAYDPAATCPSFDRFLREIQPEPEMRAFLQRWFGYTVTGLTSEQKLVFLHGTGRNGKSTLVDLIAKMMGEYATSVPIETLTGSEQRKGADATPDLVRIPGARMVRASEPEEGLRFKEAMIKLLTGGEPIMIRKMREEFVEVEPIFKLTISGNHKPTVRGTDDGIWRRILLVPFDQQVVEVDPFLPRKLWAERSGVLNWLLAGAISFLNDGLKPPVEVEEATEEFRDDSDPVRRFLVEVCEITGDGADFLSSKDIVEAFGFYLKDNGLPGWTGATIARRFAEKADVFRPNPGGPTFSRRKTTTANGYGGLRLVASMRDRVLGASSSEGDYYR